MLSAGVIESESVLYACIFDVTFVGNTYARDVTVVALTSNGPCTDDGLIVRAYT
jgi:hypothetical protein